MGPVSHTMTRMFPLHQHMLDTFMEAVGRREVKKASDPALAAPAQHEAVLRAGRHAAQLAGRQDDWDQQQQNAAQNVQRGNVKKNILEAVTTK